MRKSRILIERSETKLKGYFLRRSTNINNYSIAIFSKIINSDKFILTTIALKFMFISRIR